MRATILLLAVIGTCLAQSPGNVAPSMLPAPCSNISDVIIIRLLSQFRVLLSTPRNETAMTDADFLGLAQSTLEPDFALYSDSFSLLMDNATAPGAPCLQGVDAFVNHSRTLFQSLQDDDYWYDCSRSKVGWRWNGTLSSWYSFFEHSPTGNNTFPVKGLMELELTPSWTIEIIRPGCSGILARASERGQFDVGAAYDCHRRDFGGHGRYSEAPSGN